MSNPIDEEVYGDMTSTDPDEVKQGNPGRPQWELNAENDKRPTKSDSAHADHPTGKEHAASNIENEPG